MASKGIKKIKYEPQIDTPAEDDPDNYMILVSAKKKKWPILQIVSASLAVILATAAIVVDEISDGDVEFVEPLSSENFLDEVDYDCGWRAFRVNYIYWEGEDQIGKGQEHWAYESYIFKYSGSFCTTYKEIVDQDFCEQSLRNGKIWLGCSITAVCFLCLSIPAVWFQGKASPLYAMFLALSVLLLTIGSLNWMFNDKCEDIEEWKGEDASFNTTLGNSMFIMFAAIFCAILGLLISSLHLIAPAQKRRQQEAIQMQQPRVQTHVVQ